MASHLYKALSPQVNVTMVNPRSLYGLNTSSDLIILAVADNAITEIAEKIKGTDTLVAHTAGSIPMSTLEKYFQNYGVFYPFQTFTKDVALDYSEIPVFIEASSIENAEKLKKVANLFTQHVHQADSEKRKQLHLASVFACNFTNAMARAAEIILKDGEMDFQVVVPLMKQTLGKLSLLSPVKAQTGPAQRGDSIVIENHLKMLADKPDLKKIYEDVSAFIINSKTKDCYEK